MAISNQTIDKIGGIMSFATRLKKLTDYLYAPTNPASEDAIREDIDDSIQEVYDNVQTAMADTGGAGLVGYDGGYATVKSALEAFESGGSGTIPPDGSITDAKLATDVKVGSLATLETVVKTDVVSAINEDVTNLEILRIAELDTGAADAYVVTTAGTFSRVDGNILPFIPANANTGASTINEDGNGVADIKKWVEGVSTALEEGDLPKFQKAELVWNSSEADFFFAPKGGAVKDLDAPLVYSNNLAVATAVTTRLLKVGVSGWVVAILNAHISLSQSFCLDIDSVQFLPTVNVSEEIRENSSKHLMARFENGFEFKSSTDYLLLTYLEDDGSGLIENGIPKMYVPSAYGSGGASTLQTTIVGEGILHSMSSYANLLKSIKLDVDSINILPQKDLSTNITCEFPFKSELKVYSETTNVTTVYHKI